MSIEQKIAEILAESKSAELEEGVQMPGAETGAKDVEKATAPEGSNICCADDGETEVEGDEENNKRNNVDQQALPEVKEEVEAESKLDIQEDVAALVNGEELSEEFKQKAATIFEAAVMNRVKQEVAKLDEAYEVKLAEQVDEIKEGLVEKVDGYLDYVVEQWIAQNEIALEHGIKTEIVESFIGGMKTLFEEHYIDVPEEKYDLVAEMEQSLASLEAKLDEQVAANVEMKKSISEMQRVEIIGQASEGLTDTEVEKFAGLAEELSFEDAESFTKKVQTIRENYFNTKAQSADVKSVVTDTPVDSLNETTTTVDPSMKAYLSVLNRK